MKQKLNYHDFYPVNFTWIYLALSSLIFEKTFKSEPVPDMTPEPRAQRQRYYKKKGNILSGLFYSVSTLLFRNKIEVSRIILKIVTLTYASGLPHTSGSSQFRRVQNWCEIDLQLFTFFGKQDFKFCVNSLRCNT